VVMLGMRAYEDRKISRVSVTLNGLVTMIDNYHEKLGFYPPSGTSLFAPAVTPLYYELAGSQLSSDGSYYTNLITKEIIEFAAFTNIFGIGLVNAATEAGEAISFARSLPPSEVISFSMGPSSPSFKLIGIPVRGPPPYDYMNVWHYDSVHPTHNPKSYDLWAELVLGNKTNIIGNWKR
jgi:hypothetical protein